MKGTGKRFVAFVISCMQSLFSIALVLLYSRRTSANKLPGLVQNSKMFILANGPSLNSDINILPGSKMSAADVFVLNDFCLSGKFEEIKPAFYIINDPAYWERNQAPVQEGVARFFATMNAKVTWAMNLFIPFSGYNKIRNHFTNPHIRLVPFNNTPVEGFRFLEHFCYKRNLGVPQLQNVLVGAIYLSIFLNYKDIHLLGVDHDWHKQIAVDGENHVVWANNHFYDDDEKLNKTQRIYNGDEYFDMQQIFQALATTYKSYKKLAAFALLKSSEIVNHTKGSCIDAFKRYP